MTKPKAPWVKWTPEAFLNGVVELDAEEIGVYSIVLNLIYDRGGPIEADMERLARRLHIRPTTCEKIIAKLVRVGKLIIGDGVISNPRAERELESRSKAIENSIKNLSGGKNKVEGKSNENNNDSPQSGAPEPASAGTVDIEGRSRKTPSVSPRTREAKLKSVRIDPRRTISDSDLLFARGRGLTKKEIDHEWMRFVRYYAGLNDAAKNAKSPDWSSVWEGWVLRRAAELDREPLIEGQPASGKANPVNLSRAVWERSVQVWKKTGSWHDDLGPPPGQPGCLAPVDLVRLG